MFDRGDVKGDGGAGPVVELKVGPVNPCLDGLCQRHIQMDECGFAATDVGRRNLFRISPDMSEDDIWSIVEDEEAPQVEGPNELRILPHRRFCILLPELSEAVSLDPTRAFPEMHLREVSCVFRSWYWRLVDSRGCDELSVPIHYSNVFKFILIQSKLRPDPTPLNKVMRYRARSGMPNAEDHHGWPFC